MNIFRADELFQTAAQQAAKPMLPAFSVEELVGIGVTLVETDKTRLLTVPMKSQRYLVESVKRFGFGSAQALEQIMRRILATFGIKGRIKFYTDDTFAWCAVQSVSEAVLPKQASENFPRVLVGFVGLRRSGKDAAAQALMVDGYENVKFADALKLMLKTYLHYRGADDDSILRMIEGDLKEKPSLWFQGKSTRWAMQSLGTEWGRNLIADNLWVSTALDVCRQHEKVVISDVRFPNEVEALRSLGGKVIKVVRPTRKIDSHPSEAQIESLTADYEIFNGGTIEQLHANVRAAVSELLS